eukprot:435309_1
MALSTIDSLLKTLTPSTDVKPIHEDEKKEHIKHKDEKKEHKHHSHGKHKDGQHHHGHKKHKKKDEYNPRKFEHTSNNMSNIETNTTEMKIIEGYTRNSMNNLLVTVDVLSLILNYFKESLEIDLFNPNIGFVENDEIIKSSEKTKHWSSGQGSKYGPRWVWRYCHHYLSSKTHLRDGLLHQIRIKCKWLGRHDETDIGITTINNEFDHDYIMSNEISISNVNKGNSYFYHNHRFDGRSETVKCINDLGKSMIDGRSQLQGNLGKWDAGDIIYVLVDLRQIASKTVRFFLQKKNNKNEKEISLCNPILIPKCHYKEKFCFFIDFWSGTTEYELISYQVSYQ